MRKLIKFFCVMGIACSCSSPSLWSTHEIATGDQAFNSARLRYTSPQAHSPLLFEMVKMGDQLEAFMSLTRFRFTCLGPLKILLTIHGDSFEDWGLVHEGAMRVRLTEETTQRLIQALQDGHKVAILIDGFEEVLDPGQFAPVFDRFMGGGNFFNNLLKGPM